MPVLSPLRPHVPADERLRRWLILNPRSSSDSEGVLSEAELARIVDVLAFAWDTETLKTYGSGLLFYHVFCDRLHVPEAMRAPASSTLLASFLATAAGSYSGKTLSNYFYGVRAWHILHGASWSVNKPEMDAMLKAAERLAPETSKRSARLPITVSDIEKMKEHLDLSKPVRLSFTLHSPT